MSHQASVTYAVIPEYQDYRAGDDGSVWSNKSGQWIRMKDRPYGGHRGINLCRNGVKRCFYVHQLIMLAFRGPCPEGLEVAHDNGNPLDNRLSNLRYDTHAGNHADRRRHGTNNAGESNGMSRFTTEQVLAIRQRFASGEKKPVLMADFRASRRAINHILKRERWAHV